MDIGEGMCCGECCEMCKPDDSHTCTPGANNTLYVNKNFEKCYSLVNPLEISYKPKHGSIIWHKQLYTRVFHSEK